MGVTQEAFAADTRPSGWKEYVYCGRCGLMMGGPPPPMRPRPADWKDWAGTDTDVVCSGCGATGRENLLHCPEVMELLEEAGITVPPPWEKPETDERRWYLPEEARVRLMCSRGLAG